MSFWDVFVDHYILTALVAFVALVWCYFRFFTPKKGVCESKMRLDGKTVIVTGCTSGIGKATAFDLARRGARIIMAGIGLKESEQTRDEIINQTKNHNIVVHLVDMGLMSSVRQFAEEIKGREKRLDVLVHNAGILKAYPTATEEGLNNILAVNFFGPFLLAHLLMDLLAKTENSRIVMVGSMIHTWGRIDLSNVNFVQDPTLSERLTVQTYSTSKLYVALFTKKLARLLTNYRISVNCADPGVVDTPIAFGRRSFVLWLLRKKCIKTPEEGAQTAIYLSVSEEVQGKSGKNFADCQEKPFAKLCDDEDLAGRFWKICEEIVQLKPSEIIRQDFEHIQKDNK